MSSTGFGSNQDGDAKKLKQELADKDAKIKEMNNVVQQLQQKL